MSGEESRVRSEGVEIRGQESVVKMSGMRDEG